MLVFASGEITASKPLPEDLVEGDAGYIQDGAYYLDYGEYSNDEVECDMKKLSEYAKENDITLYGEVTAKDDNDGCNGIYDFDNTAEYEEIWGDAATLKEMDTSDIIEELKCRGYSVIENMPA